MSGQASPIFAVQTASSTGSISSVCMSPTKMRPNVARRHYRLISNEQRAQLVKAMEGSKRTIREVCLAFAIFISARLLKSLTSLIPRPRPSCGYTRTKDASRKSEGADSSPRTLSIVLSLWSRPISHRCLRSALQSCQFLMSPSLFLRHSFCSLQANSGWHD